jgi:DNA invertase Pin-like site-specific DNA recombinase
VPFDGPFWHLFRKFCPFSSSLRQSRHIRRSLPPAGGAALAHFEAGKIDGIFIYEPDRLSRVFIDFARLREGFEAPRTSLESGT